MSKNSNDHPSFDRDVLRQVMSLNNLGLKLEKSNSVDIEKFISIIMIALKNVGEGMSDVKDALAESEFYIKADENLQEGIQDLLTGIVFGATSEAGANELVDVLRHMQRWDIQDLQKETQRLEKENLNNTLNMANNGMNKTNSDVQEDLTKKLMSLLQLGYKRLDIAAMIRSVNVSDEFDPLTSLPVWKQNLTPKIELEIRGTIVDLAELGKSNPQMLRELFINAAEGLAKSSKYMSIKDRIKSLNEAGLKGEFKPLQAGFEPSDKKPILTRRGALHRDKQVEDFIKSKSDENFPKKPGL